MPDPDLHMLADQEELAQLGHRLRSAGCRTTNLLVGNRRLANAADAGLLRATHGESGSVILFNDRGAQRVYFAQLSADTAVAALIACAPVFNDRTVADVTGREGQFEAFDDIFARAGFRSYKCFRRMSRRPAAVESVDSSAMRSLEPGADIGQVLSMIDAVFDPLAEFMPDEPELQALLHRGGILVESAPDGTLRGFLVHETIGNTSLLRYVAVRPDARGRGIGGQLIARYLHDTARAVRHDLWVWDRNDRAIKQYIANGYAFTGQCNKIYRFEE